MRSNLPLELAKLLAARGYGAAMLAKLMTRQGNAVTKQFLFQIIHGERPAPVKQIKAIARALELSDDQKLRLNRAAALDEGYEI